MKRQSEFTKQTIDMYGDVGMTKELFTNAFKEACLDVFMRVLDTTPKEKEPKRIYIEEVFTNAKLKQV